MSTPHRIHRQVLEVACQTEAQGFALRERLARVQKESMTPIFERCFDGFDLDGELLRFDKLVVDLGEVDAEGLEHQLVETLEERLLDAVGKAFGRAPAVSSEARAHSPEIGSGDFPEPGNALLHLRAQERTPQSFLPSSRRLSRLGEPSHTAISVPIPETAEPSTNASASFRPAGSDHPESNVELLETFARSGRAPWWADLGDPRLVEHAVDRVLIQSPSELAAWLREACDLRRLVLALDDRRLASLLGLLAPGPWLENVQRLLATVEQATVEQATVERAVKEGRAVTGPEAEIRKLRQAIWLSAFAAASPRHFDATARALAGGDMPNPGAASPEHSSDQAGSAGPPSSGPESFPTLAETLESLGQAGLSQEICQRLRRALARALAAGDVPNARALAGGDVPNARALAAGDVPNARALAAGDVPNARALAAGDVPNARLEGSLPEPETHSPNLQRPTGSSTIPRSTPLSKPRATSVATEKLLASPRRHGAAPLPSGRNAAARQDADLDRRRAPTGRRNDSSTESGPSVHGATPRSIFRVEDDSRILTHSAGLVLLWPFLERYFERLSLLREGVFASAGDRHRAAGFLHRLATGESETREYQLALEKRLCGLDSDSVVDLGPPATERELEEAGRLVESVAHHTKSLHGLSVDEFRGVFLRRLGSLSFSSGPDLLRVERQPWDDPLASLPWVWNWVRLPWMQTVLEVAW